MVISRETKLVVRETNHKHVFSANRAFHINIKNMQFFI